MPDVGCRVYVFSEATMAWSRCGHVVKLRGLCDLHQPKLGMVGPRPNRHGALYVPYTLRYWGPNVEGKRATLVEKGRGEYGIAEDVDGGYRVVRGRYGWNVWRGEDVVGLALPSPQTAGDVVLGLLETEKAGRAAEDAAGYSVPDDVEGAEG